MKTILPSSASSIYSVRIGGEECRVRGYEIEPIEAIFADSPSAGRHEPDASPWEDVTGPDELVAERMSAPPVIRRRSRLVASRAVLLGADISG